MQIPGISASDTPFGAQQVDPGLGKDAFMELLVTQMQNQNPLEPQANEEFIAQLANFSSLEQMEQMNDNLLTMITLNQTNALLDQLTSSSALIGKHVSWTDPSTGISQEGAVESVMLDGGLAILKIDGVDVPLAAIDNVSGTQADTTESAES